MSALWAPGALWCRELWESVQSTQWWSRNHPPHTTRKILPFSPWTFFFFFGFLFILSLNSFIEVLYFQYMSRSPLFVPKYFTLLDAIINRIVRIGFSFRIVHSSQLMYTCWSCILPLCWICLLALIVYIGEDSLGTSVCRITLSSNIGSFTSFFPVWISIISVNSKDESRYPCLIPDFRGKA